MPLDMTTEQHIDSRNLRITGQHKAIPEPHFSVTNDVVIVVTQAFGPKGDNLVGISDVKFDGYPAVTLLVEANGKRGQVHLSPIHGDMRKEGFTDIAPGTKCKLLCPVSEQPLDKLEGSDDDGAAYYALYLTPELNEGSSVAISNEWGHYHSRIVDNFELISDWSH
jgi:hypothetical protein